MDEQSIEESTEDEVEGHEARKPRRAATMRPLNRLTEKILARPLPQAQEQPRKRFSQEMQPRPEQGEHRHDTHTSPSAIAVLTIATALSAGREHATESARKLDCPLKLGLALRAVEYRHRS